MKFNKSNVHTIPIPSDKLKRNFPEHIVFDEDKPGFGIRIRPAPKGGVTRSYIFQCKVGEKHSRITIGNVAKLSLQDAKTQADKFFAIAVAGENPSAVRRRKRAEASETLGLLVADYLVAKQRVLRPRTYVEARRHLESLWKPIHGYALSELSDKKAIMRQFNAIAANCGDVAANRARATLSALFRWAMGEGRAIENPIIGTNKKAEDDPRERTLTDHEVAAVWNAAEKLDSEYGRIVQLLMLTGCRREEIGALEWDEIDLEAKTITLPKARTKNKTEFEVPLADRAVAIIEAIPRRDRTHVFGSGKGGYVGWSQSKISLDAAIKQGGKPIADWRIHDIRRTVRTGLGRLKVQPHIAKAVLNHLPAKLIRTYDRNPYAAEKRQALELWDNHLATALAMAEGANVTRLRKV